MSVVGEPSPGSSAVVSEPVVSSPMEELDRLRRQIIASHGQLTQERRKRLLEQLRQKEAQYRKAESLPPLDAGQLSFADLTQMTDNELVFRVSALKRLGKGESFTERAKTKLVQLQEEQRYRARVRREAAGRGRNTATAKIKKDTLWNVVQTFQNYTGLRYKYGRYTDEMIGKHDERQTAQDYTRSLIEAEATRQLVDYYEKNPRVREERLAESRFHGQDNAVELMAKAQANSIDRHSGTGAEKLDTSV